MQSNFAPCLAFVLKQEGGKVDSPKDPGGRTNQGVTQTTYNAFRRGRGQAVADVYLMTPDERDAIYQANFWNAVGGDTAPVGVDLALFDYGTNSGPARARKARPTRIMPPADEVRAICATRTSFLHGLKTWVTFGKGWARRVAACEALGVKMAFAATGDPHETAMAEYADSAASKAKAAKAGTLTAATAGAGTSASMPVAVHGTSSLIVLVAVLILLALMVAVFAWRAMHQKARADAYAEQAKS